MSASAEAKAVLVQRGPVQIAEGAVAASSRTKAASGEGSAARTPEGAVIEYAKVAAAPIEWFAVPDNAEVVPVEEIAASVIWKNGSYTCWVDSVVRVRDPLLHDFQVLLIVAHAESDLSTLYHIDYSTCALVSHRLQCFVSHRLK